MNKGANRHGGGGPLIGYSSSQRRQIMASLRRCFRVLGLKRDNPGTGALGQGCVRLAGIALVVLSPTLYILAGASEALGQTIPRDGWNYQWSFTTMTADVAPIVTSTMQTTAPQQGSTSTTVQGANPNPTSQGSTLSAANPGNIILTINTDQSAPAGSNDVLTLQGTVNDPNEGTPRYRNFFTGYVDSTTSLTNVIIGDRWGDPNNLSKTIINGGILQFGNGASVNTGGAIGIGVASKSGAAPNASGGGRGVAIGTESNAMTTGGSSPVAIGWGANAQGGGSQIAIGDQSAATGFNSVALGGNAGAPATAATGSYALAIGPSTKATAENTVSMGRTAMASAADAIAIGGNATAGANASASGAVAIGAQTTASAANGVAIGNGASISSTGTDTNVAMGANSTADGSTLSASAYNPGSTILAGISPVGEVSIGSSRKERRMTNVAAGANATDAVNVSQLTSLDTKVDNQGNGIATVIGGGSSYDPAIGKLNTPTDIGGTGKDNINDAIAAANAAANTGWNLQANGDTASQVKPGDTVQFTDGHNIAITRNGEKLTVSTTPNLTADSLTAGNTKIDTNGLTIMGGPSVLASGIDAGGKKITDVAAGDLTATSADAVNGSQLFTTNEWLMTLGNQLNGAGGFGQTMQSVLGGNAHYDTTTGGMTMSNIGGTGKDNINDAIQAANTAASAGWNLQANGDTASQVKPGDTVQFTNGQNIAITRNGENLTIATAPDLTANSLTAGNTTINNSGLTIQNGPSVTSSGIDAGGQKVTNVADGTVAAGSKDAVNGGQLHNTANSVASALGGGSKVNSDGTVSAPSYTVQGNTYNNVGSALGAVDSNITNLGTTVNSIGGDVTALKNGTAGVVQRSGENGTVLTAPGGTGANPGAAQTLGNVADGEVNGTSKQAVNGSQLYDTNQQLADVEKTAGNSVQYDTNPNGTRANTVTLQGGDANAPVVLKNVGTGTDDTDAVNVKQLKDGNAQTLASANTYTDTKTEWAVDQSKAYTDTTAGNTLKSANAYTDQKFDALDQQMGNLSSQIGDVRKEARQAAAIGLAAASLRYDDRPGKLSAAISGGYWRDQGAFAFGVGYTSESGRLRANISGTTAGGHVGAGAGLSYTFN